MLYAATLQVVNLTVQRSTFNVPRSTFNVQRVNACGVTQSEELRGSGGNAPHFTFHIFNVFGKAEAPCLTTQGFLANLAHRRSEILNDSHDK